MTGILISYRREDSSPSAGRLYDVMVRHFGRDQVFLDIDVISPGEDFREAIRRACSSCKVLLAIIGREWANVRDKNGKLRLDSESDYVRLEIAFALQKGIRVIPVLVSGAGMPEESALPPDLRAIVYRNAYDVSERHFHQDVQLLVDALKKTLSIALPQINLAPPTREMPSLFPLFGITLGISTVSQLAKIACKTTMIDDTFRMPYHYYIWRDPNFSGKGINFWYDPTTCIVDHMYMVYHQPLPEPWEKLGFRWENSYDQWIELLQDIGYQLKVEKWPRIERYDSHDSFSATVVGRREAPHPHTIELEFKYSKGTMTNSPATLYSIAVRAY
jgi:hypothetical protein